MLKRPFFVASVVLLCTLAHNNLSGNGKATSGCLRQYRDGHIIGQRESPPTRATNDTNTDLLQSVQEENKRLRAKVHELNELLALQDDPESNLHETPKSTQRETTISRPKQEALQGVEGLKSSHPEKQAPEQEASPTSNQQTDSAEQDVAKQQHKEAQPQRQEAMQQRQAELRLQKHLAVQQRRQQAEEERDESVIAFNAEAPQPNYKDPSQAPNNLFNPNLTMEDYYHFSKPMIPTNGWFDGCETALINNTKLVHPFVLEPYNIGYRLGDCIRWCTHCETCTPRELRNETNLTAIRRLAFMYEVTRCRDYMDLYNLTHIRKELFPVLGQREGFVRPDPRDVVVHLRLGDVIETQKRNASALLRAGGYGDHPDFRQIRSIRPFQEYMDILEEIKGQYDKVVIVGGSHRSTVFKTGRTYAHCLQRGLAMAGHKVDLHLDDRSADKDFYFMAHSKFFIGSTGGYSKTMADLATMGGGKVWFFPGWEKTTGVLKNGMTNAVKKRLISFNKTFGT